MAGVLLRPVWPVARREEGASPRSGAVTDEKRSHRPNWAQPKGRQSFSLQASLLTPCRSTSGYARRSRLAWTEKPLPQNTSHVGDTTLEISRGLSASDTPGRSSEKEPHPGGV